MARQMLKDTAAVGGVGLIAGGMKAAYLVFLGRSLTPSEFSIFGLVFASLGVLTVVMSVFNAIVFRYVSYFTAKSQQDKLVTFLRSGLMLVAVCAAALAAIIFFAAENISGITHILDINIIRVGGLVVAFEMVVFATIGVLSGLGRYRALAQVRLVQGFVVLVAGMGLIFTGVGVMGALLALIIGNVISIPLGLMLARADFFARPARLGKIGLWRYAGMAVLVSLSLGVLMNVDVVLGKVVFSAEEAGLYAAAAIIGSVLYLFSETVTRVMFPRVAKLHSDGLDALPLLREGLQYTAVGGVLFTIGVIAFPGIVRALAFGAGYEVESLLRWYIPGMLLLSMVVVLALYRLAVRDYLIGVYLAIAAAIKIALVFWFAYSPLLVAQTIFALHLALFCVLVFVYRDTIKDAMRKKKGYFSYVDILGFPQAKENQ